MESLQDHWVQNGGSVLAIAGENYAVIASDSRISVKSTILSNNQLKTFRLLNNTAIGLCGAMVDAMEVVDRLEAELRTHAEEKGRPMSLQETADMVSLLLYQRRIFPYYVQVPVLVARNLKGVCRLKICLI
uniref:Proteasome subunit beta type-1 n=1 Tax=Cacopsylla melanoneura TaxID=428564 RepID=A0A8D8ZRA6_9HEMI